MTNDKCKMKKYEVGSQKKEGIRTYRHCERSAAICTNKDEIASLCSQ